MPMNGEEIQLVLIDVLKEVQSLSGDEWVDLPRSATPFDILPGFDSLRSVEASVLVEEKLNCSILTDESLFISRDGKALSLEDTASLVEKLLNEKRGSL